MIIIIEILSVCKLDRKKKEKKLMRHKARNRSGFETLNNTTGHSLADHRINRRAN